VKKEAALVKGRWLAGVDGCRAGWVAVLKSLDNGKMETVLLAELKELFIIVEEPVLVGVDTPIGLLSEARPGGRECDQAARRIMGRVKSSSVFSPPVRAALRAETYDEALRLNRASSRHGLGISRQTFGLFPKLRELDSLMNPGRQEVIKEVHPEVSFQVLNNGRAVAEKKKSPAGIGKRRELLAARGLDVYDQARPQWLKKEVADSDILDAAAVLFSAERIHLGRAIRLPGDDPPRDEKGLLMEIWS
jgi:predicted RNase H-like nuclease